MNVPVSKDHHGSTMVAWLGKLLPSVKEQFHPHMKSVCYWAVKKWTVSSPQASWLWGLNGTKHELDESPQQQQQQNLQVPWALIQFLVCLSWSHWNTRGDCVRCVPPTTITDQSTSSSSWGEEEKAMKNRGVVQTGVQGKEEEKWQF